MAPDDHSGAKPAGPVVLRIKLRYDDLDAMVQRFAANVGKSGLFLPTRSMQPLGTEVKFELRLANDTPVLVGLGRVKHVRPPDPANPRAAFGMAIELMRVTREGREVIIRMIERRRQLGLADVAIPLPEDVESARRADMDSQPRADTSGIVREAMAQMASAPVAEQILTARPTTGPLATVKLESGPVMTSGPVVAPPAAAPADSGPIAKAADLGAIAKAADSGGIAKAADSGGIAKAADSGPIAKAADSDPIAKPAARESGPIAKPATFAAARESGAIAKPTIAALAPEAPRKQRPRIGDLIAQAESGPIAAAPAELDEHVDIERVLARARALATGDLDVELATLREEAAAPIEISVEAASAELARQLGGHAIARRDRSARWAPPPAVTPVSEPVMTPVREPEPAAGESARLERAAGEAARHEPASADSAQHERERGGASEPAGHEREAVAAGETAQDEREAVAAGEAAQYERESAATREPAPDERESAASRDPAHHDRESDASREPAQYERESDATREPAQYEREPVEAREPPQYEREPVAAGEAMRTRSEPAVVASDDDDAFDAGAPGTTTAVEPVETAHRTFAPPGSDDIATDPAAAPRPRALVVAEHEHDDDDEEIEELDSLDVVPDDEAPSESTQIGAMPVDPNAMPVDPNAFQHHGQPTVPDELAARLDAHLDAAEREADEDLGLADAHQEYAQRGYADGQYAQGQYAQGEYADAQPAEGQYAEGQYAQRDYAQGEHGEAQYAQAPYAEGHYREGEHAPSDDAGAHGGYPPAAYPQGAYAPSEFGEGEGNQHAHGDYAPSEFGEGEGNQHAHGDYAPSEFGEGEGNQHARGAYAQRGYAQGDYGHGEFEQGEYAAAAPDDDEEISDLDVLAEADAADADLMSAHAEQEAPVAAPVEGSYDYGAPGYAPPAHELGAQPYPPAGEGSFDFAARLDLGDDESNHRRPAPRPVDPRRARSYGDGYDDGAPAYADRRREPSYGEERYDYDAPSSSYTFAERGGGYEADPYAEEAPAQLTPIASPPLPQPSMLREPPPEDYDLENALEALDVDLDELSPAVREHRPALPGLTPANQARAKQPTGGHPPAPLPRAASEIDTARPRTRKAETPARALAAVKPTKPKRAATEDDGVLIDFDDDDD